MPSRSDLLPFALGAAGLAVVLFLFSALGYSSVYHVYATHVFELPVFVYAAYWAFAIRRGLTTGLFRRQALGIALVALGFGVGSFASGVAQEATAGTGVGLIVAFFVIIFFNPFIIFYWVDSTTLASRRADPLGREVLRWSQVRKVCWALMIGALILLLSIVAYANLSGLIEPSGQVAPTLANMFPSGISILTPILVVVVAGVVSQLFVIRRARDRAFRSHVFWFLLFVPAAVAPSVLAVLFHSFLPAYAACPLWFIPAQNGFCAPATNLPYSVMVIELLDEIVSYASLVAAGFFLYRSSKSLVLMNVRSVVEKQIL